LKSHLTRFKIKFFQILMHYFVDEFLFCRRVGSQDGVFYSDQNYYNRVQRKNKMFNVMVL
jgi:hypothetical protein